MGRSNKIETCFVLPMENNREQNCLSLFRHDPEANSFQSRYASLFVAFAILLPSKVLKLILWKRTLMDSCLHRNDDMEIILRILLRHQAGGRDYYQNHHLLAQHVYLV